MRSIDVGIADTATRWMMPSMLATFTACNSGSAGADLRLFRFPRHELAWQNTPKGRTAPGLPFNPCKRQLGEYDLEKTSACGRSGRLSDCADWGLPLSLATAGVRAEAVSRTAPKSSASRAADQLCGRFQPADLDDAATGSVRRRKARRQARFHAGFDLPAHAPDRGHLRHGVHGNRQHHRLPRRTERGLSAARHER